MKASMLQRFNWWCRNVWRREPALAPLRWQTSTKLIRSNFRRILSEPKGSEAFDAEYLKVLSARRVEKIGIAHKLMVFSLTLTAIMAGWLLVDNLSFSLLGLSGQRIDQLVEFVRVLSSLVAVYIALLGLEARQAKNVIDEICAYRCPLAPSYLGMAYAAPGEGIVELAPTPAPNIHKSPALLNIIRFWIAGTLTAVTVVIAASWVISTAVLWLMFTTPTIGPFISRAMACTAILIDLVSLTILGFMYLPLPMRDYTDVVELHPILEKQGREAWNAELQRRLALRKTSKGSTS